VIGGGGDVRWGLWRVSRGGRADDSGGSAVAGDEFDGECADAAGVIQMILNGIPWREGRAAPYMPSFALALTDAQVAAIAAYLRTTYSDKPAWTMSSPR